MQKESVAQHKNASRELGQSPSDAELLWEARGLIETAAELAWNTNCDIEEAQFRGFLERTRLVHASDCATHNMPAYPNGPCDCQPVVKVAAEAPNSATEGSHI